MSKYSIKKLILEEENLPQDGANVSTMRVNYNIVVTPTNATAQEASDAFGDLENYGTFKTQALRNSSTNKAEINNAIEKHFGPSIPSKKKAALKLRGGEPFPIRTKQSLDDFMKQFNPKPKLLTWEIKGDSLVFLQSKNPVKNQIKNIVDMVMKEAGITYEINEKEDI